MMFPKKTGALLVAGLAAWAYYKYNKMSPEAKEKLMGDLKKQGKRFMDTISPAFKNKSSNSQDIASTMS